MWRDAMNSAARFWLFATVHLDVLLKRPRAYLTAAMWWVLRKRVRARGQFSALLGQSRKAYSLWGFVHERDLAVASPPAHPPIYALIDARRDRAGLERTTASLEAESIVPLVVTQDEEAITRLADVVWEEDPWFAFPLPGDRIAPGAAAAYRDAMQGRDVRLVYADDDALDRWGRRTAPHLKPDWNSELFRFHDFVTGACILRAGREDVLTEFVRGGGHGVVSHVLREDDRAVHVKRILHHRHTRPKPRYAPIARASRLPLVTAIVPTRNRVDLLATCLAGLEAADYPHLEVIVVDNDSDDPATIAFLAGLPGKGVRVLRHSGPFNYSAINNRAVAEARGELLCLLNNDIEMIAPDWLAIMATQAMRDDVGAVGAQLLYPDGRIQHAGVVIGVGNAAGHAHRFLDPKAEGYFHRHKLPQFVSAVTAACLVVKRERFLAVGGLDEDNFKVAFNDVDLCLRLNQRGWQSLYEPRAVLVHHESVSRGHDTDPVGAARFAGELAALKRLWKTDAIVDPFHHPYLSRASEQFAVAL